MVNPILLFAFAIGLQVVGFLLQPRPAQPTPPTAEDIRTPTAEAGRPIPIPFGDVRVQSLNNLFFGDLSVVRRMIRAPQ